MCALKCMRAQSCACVRACAGQHYQLHQHKPQAQLSDQSFPSIAGELFLALVHSSKAYAKLVSVDPSEALAMPGVVDYISHQDVPGSNSWSLQGRELRLQQEEIFATTEVN